MQLRASTTAVCLVVLLHGRGAALEPAAVVPLWPAGTPAPGPALADATKPERPVDDRRRPFRQITNVSVPTLSAYLPREEDRTGSAMLVCPGGGMQRLAIEHEGEEVAAWLVEQGIAALVLKYRVPAPSRTGMLDAQRALRIIHDRADDWSVDAGRRLGAIGFSAGAEVAILVATNADPRTHPLLDDVPSRLTPLDHIAAIYPGGLVRPGATQLRDDIASKLKPGVTPPMFIAHAFHDAGENSLALATALKRARVPLELHVYPEGGHGVGVRDSNLPLAHWKDRYREFLEARGFLDPPYVNDYVRILRTVRDDQHASFRRLSAQFPTATLADGYAVQRRFVAERRAKGERIGGLKASKVFADQQQALGVDEPLTGVLFASGRIDAKPGLVVDVSSAPGTLLETEVGYIIGDGVDLSTRVTPEQARATVQAIVPMIELPNSFAGRLAGDLTAADLVAINIGSARYIVGEPRINPDAVDADAIEVALTKDGAERYRAKADAVKGGQWANLAALINGAIDRGRAVRSGEIILSGALGDVKPAGAGKYRADFSGLGAIEFELK